jgi:hypothetical protein
MSSNDYAHDQTSHAFMLSTLSTCTNYVAENPQHRQSMSQTCRPDYGCLCYEGVGLWRCRRKQHSAFLAQIHCTILETLQTL